MRRRFDDPTPRPAYLPPPTADTGGQILTVIISRIPRSLEPDGPGGVLHAKAVVADREAVFVTSANLTEAALDRNIELGLLVRDRALAASVVSHFRGLIRLHERYADAGFSVVSVSIDDGDDAATAVARRPGRRHLSSAPEVWNRWREDPLPSGDGGFEPRAGSIHRWGIGGSELTGQSSPEERAGGTGIGAEVAQTGAGASPARSSGKRSRCATAKGESGIVWT